MNAAAGQIVNLVESWYSLALRVYGMVSSVGTIVEPSREVIACKVATAQVQHATRQHKEGKA